MYPAKKLIPREFIRPQLNVFEEQKRGILEVASSRVCVKNKNFYILPHLWHTNAEWWDTGRTSCLPVNFRGCWGQPHSCARAPWSRIRRCMSHLVASGTKQGLSHLTTSLQYIHACSCPNSLIHQQFLERANCCIALAGRVTKHSHTLLGVQCTSTSHCKAMLPGQLW